MEQVSQLPSYINNNTKKKSYRLLHNFVTQCLLNNLSPNREYNHIINYYFYTYGKFLILESWLNYVWLFTFSSWPWVA